MVDVLAGLWQPVAHALLVPPSLPAMLTVALLAMVLLAVTVAAAPRLLAWLPGARSVTAFREKSRHPARVRQRDPDAAGHARPRAPSAVPAAA